MSGKLKVRIPLLESLADLGQGALLTSQRPLTSVERKLLTEVFQGSIDLTLITLASTKIGAKGRPYTLGNTIRVPEGTSLTNAVLVHEATHVWQYQTKGTGYISGSVVHQAIKGSDAYKVELVPGKKFTDYEAEQQAMIVQKYYQDEPKGWKKDPDVVRMIAEVRSARPIPESVKQKDRWFGPATEPWNDFSRPPDRADRLSPTVPLVRWEF